MERIIRFFCMVGPRAPKGHTGVWWPDLAWSYANALLFTAIPMRIFPIGKSELNGKDPEDGYARWREMAPLFGGPMAESFANVVCAPVCVNMTEERTFSVPRAGKIVVPAETALAALWTANHRNIAITDWTEALSSASFALLKSETEALRKYDLVLVSSERQQDQLLDLDVQALYYTPEKLSAEARVTKLFLGKGL